MSHHRKEITHSREAEAKIEIGHTEITRPLKHLLFWPFILTIFLIPSIQIVLEIMDANDGEYLGINTFQMFQNSEKSLRDREKPKSSQGGNSLLESKLFESNRSLLKRINDYEKNLEDSSILRNGILPWAQKFLIETLSTGTEEVYLGLDDWLFYRLDFESVVGPGFLSPQWILKRKNSAKSPGSEPSPDPLPAIIDLKNQLEKRGIALIVMPTPVKFTVEADKFAPESGKSFPIHNASYGDFINRLEENGVIVFDSADYLMRLKKERPDGIYLKTDTHWRPETVSYIASELARFIKEKNLIDSTDSQSYQYKKSSKEIVNSGDIARLFKAQDALSGKFSEKVEIAQVLDGVKNWKTKKKSRILLIGDSFTNIFSLEGMGWGDSAGLAEQISFAMKEDMDVLSRNDAGAFASREMLALEIRHGNDRLEGKKLLIWQFSERELVFGDWKIIPLEKGDELKGEREFFVPQGSASLEIAGIISEISPAPRPGTVPYKDHIVALHLIAPESGEASGLSGKDLVVLTWSMRDNVWTNAARLRPGEKVRIKVSDWKNYESKYGSYNITLPEDEELVFAPFCWAEEINK